MTYLRNQNANTNFCSSKGAKETIDILVIEKALTDTHLVIGQITKNIPVDVFSILGMRNLSAFIGELFAASLIKESNGKYIKNPHQDGYPDLLLMNASGTAAYAKLERAGQLRDKGPFSPFADGGLEIKATCGSVPTPAVCQKKGQQKPGIGDTRIGLMKSYDWKAHHQETKNLIGIFWDFHDRVPHIIAVFFGNNLIKNDWGGIIQPKTGGGRTTSVSIMTRLGVKKMYSNWLVVEKDPRYTKFFNTYNNGKIM